MKKFFATLSFILVTFFACTVNVFAMEEARIEWLQHKVAEGETMYSISVKYNVPIYQLQIANEMSEDEFTVYADSYLTIPTLVIHTVTYNSNTVDVLAHKYNSSVEEIMQMNSLETTELTVGQRVIVRTPFYASDWPPRKTSATTTSTTTTTTTTTTTYFVVNAPSAYDINGDGATSISDVIHLCQFINEDPRIAGRQLFWLDVNEDGAIDMVDVADLLQFIAQPRENLFDYEIQSGDTITNISKRFNVSQASIMALNPNLTDPNKINVGDYLRINAVTTTTTVTTTSTSITTVTTTTTTNQNELESMISNFVSQQEAKYAGINIGIGIYNLETGNSYYVNGNEAISGGCTVKAAFELFALQECEKRNLDISTYTLTYKEEHYNSGSGVIKKSAFGTEYTLEYLFRVLLEVSDNTAYNILLDEFGIGNFQTYLDSIEGQQLNYRKYGDVTAVQRVNEWRAIWDYINSDAQYASVLKYNLDIAQYSYVQEGFINSHEVLHKSGWCTGNSYTCAADGLIIDSKYAVVILTEDYTTGTAHTDVVRQFGAVIEKAIENGLL